MPHIPSPRQGKRPRLEIIPFIDIMFFLLATFMMVSLSMVRNEGLDVNLPAATSATPQDREEAATITVTASGSYHWNQEELDLPSLVGRLLVLKQNQDDPKIFIHGDAKADFEHVVALLDETRKLGIRKVAIQTTRPPGDAN